MWAPDWLIVSSTQSDILSTFGMTASSWLVDCKIHPEVLLILGKQCPDWFRAPPNWFDYNLSFWLVDSDLHSEWRFTLECKLLIGWFWGVHLEWVVNNRMRAPDWLIPSSAQLICLQCKLLIGWFENSTLGDLSTLEWELLIGWLLTHHPVCDSSSLERELLIGWFRAPPWVMFVDSVWQAYHCEGVCLTVCVYEWNEWMSVFVHSEEGLLSLSCSAAQQVWSRKSNIFTQKPRVPQCPVCVCVSGAVHACVSQAVRLVHYLVWWAVEAAGVVLVPPQQLLSKQNAMLQNTNVLNNCTWMYIHEK